MPAEAPKPDPIVIAAYLDDVDSELDAATRLMAEPVTKSGTGRRRGQRAAVSMSFARAMTKHTTYRDCAHSSPR